MAKETRQIRIESILGGHTQISHFAAEDQFLTSAGIDPSLGYSDDDGAGRFGSGLIRPSSSTEIGPSTLQGAPMWMRIPPGGSGISGQYVYIYCANGSVYTIPFLNGKTTTIADSGSNSTDLNDGGSASGNGMAYYDNYMYFARDTTIARLGPLNGSSSWTDDFWVGTLGKAALGSDTYPSSDLSSGICTLPSHVLHRHSDGKLYIADVVDGQGTIHYIKTTKTTVEGDTDDGSSYDALNVGYKLFPTAMESYGEYLVISFLEIIGSFSGSTQRDSRTTAKIAFWDTTSDKVNQLVWVEYPDPLITAIKNINGVLYFFSGGVDVRGYRVLRYVGGTSFEEVFSSKVDFPPYPGAVDGTGDQLVYGVTTNTPTGKKVVVASLGLDARAFGRGIFHIHRTTTLFGSITSLFLDKGQATFTHRPIVGWADSSDFGIDIQDGYGNAQNEWYSQFYRIGQPFKITKIRIPLLKKLTANMRVIVRIYKDGIDEDVVLDLPEITSANFGTNTRQIVIRPKNLTVENAFSLALLWPTGSTDLCIIALPITIEYELLDVDTTTP